MLLDDGLAEITRKVEVLPQGRIAELSLQHPESLEVNEMAAIRVQHGTDFKQASVSDCAVPALGLQLAHANVKPFDR